MDSLTTTWIAPTVSAIVATIVTQLLNLWWRRNKEVMTKHATKLAPIVKASVSVMFFIARHAFSYWLLARPFWPHFVSTQPLARGDVVVIALGISLLTAYTAFVIAELSFDVGLWIVRRQRKKAALEAR